jgi:hypothetical protein
MHPDGHPVPPGEPSEHVVERAVLLDQEDDVLDREPRGGPAGASGGSLPSRSPALGLWCSVVETAAVQAEARRAIAIERRMIRLGLPRLTEGRGVVWRAGGCWPIRYPGTV